jgi:hypothetical protein
MLREWRDRETCYKNGGTEKQDERMEGQRKIIRESRDRKT